MTSNELKLHFRVGCFQGPLLPGRTFAARGNCKYKISCSLNLASLQTVCLLKVSQTPKLNVMSLELSLDFTLLMKPRS